jgi:UDP-sugar transporter A1/2/3
MKKGKDSESCEIKITEEDNKKKNASVSSEVTTSKFILILLIAIGLKSWQPIAVGMSKEDDGSYSYNKTFMVIMTEFFKLVFCTVMFLFQFFTEDPVSRRLLIDLSFSQSLHFIVPSILYAFANTLVFIGMSYINPALFHVFGNIRIMTAGVLYRVVMQKPQTDLQWISLALLTFGAVLASPSQGYFAKPGEDNAVGLMACFMMCVCSSASSIYTEINYKKTKYLSIFFQNMVLYLYGIIVNFIWLAATEGENIANGEIFDGFDFRAAQVLVTQGLMGVSLSFIFKYLDNITYVIAFTVSMFVSAVLSIYMFDFKFTIQFFIALSIVTISVYLYYREKILEKFGFKHETAIC